MKVTMMTNAIEFINVFKTFSNSTRPALNNINFKIEEGEFITIVGTSGCGKTTLIKLINRLHDADSGEIKIFNKDISTLEVTALRKSIGYVIQQIGLFPHMTIYKNIATVPRMLGWAEEKIDDRVHELMKLVHLNSNELLSRYPSQLSGGQQQRVGLARALAAYPQLMLLDEPFGAVDAINRNILQEELLNIHQENKKTFLFVTHDINEAFKLGNRIIIMDKGEIQQFGTPHDILNHPSNDFVKSFIRFYNSPN